MNIFSPFLSWTYSRINEVKNIFFNIGTMVSLKNYLWTITRIFSVSFPICSPTLVSYSFLFQTIFIHSFLITRFWHSLDWTSYVFYQFFKTWLFTHTDLFSFLFYTFQISSKYLNIYQEKNDNQPTNQFVILSKRKYMTMRRFFYWW